MKRPTRQMEPVDRLLAVLAGALGVAVLRANGAMRPRIYNAMTRPRITCWTVEGTTGKIRDLYF